MLVGQVLQNRYHLVACIHSNTACDTYMALDKSLESSSTQYILKYFWPAPENAGQILEKRLQTAAQIQQFNHIAPQIPALVKYWLEGDRLVLAYEYIDSLPLNLTNLSETQMIAVLAEIFEVLQPLHQRQIGHGNLHLGQLARRVADQKLIITDLGSLALSEHQSFGDPQLPTLDLQALGQIVIQAMTETAGSHWRENLDTDFVLLIDRLLTQDTSRQWNSVMPPWLELGKIMQRLMAVNTAAPPPHVHLAELNALQARVDQQLLAGNGAGAVADCTRLIELETNPLYFHNRGIIYAQELKEYDLAIQDYNMVISLSPTFVHAYKNRAYAQHQLGNLAAAIADYTHSLQILPNLAICYWERGLIYQELGELQLALADFTEFLVYNAYHPEAYTRRGYVYQQLGDLGAALADYEQAIHLNPGLALAYYHRGDCQARQGHFTEAIADYTQAVANNPQWATLYQKRGVLHYQQGAIDLARQDYQQALALEPTAALYYQYGLIAEEPEVARASFDQALALDSQLLKAYIQRGSLARRQGDLERAFADYSQGLVCDSESIDCLCGRGIVRQELQDFGGAISDYQRAAHLCLSQGRQEEYEKLLKIIESLQRLGL